MFFALLILSVASRCAARLGNSWKTPRIHIYDLPARLLSPCHHIGCGLLTRRIKESEYYEKDHTKAEMFLVDHGMPFLNSNVAPAIYEYIRQTWPYINMSIALKQTRHFVFLTCDHGPGDCAYVRRPIHLGQHPSWWDPVHPDRIVGHLQFNGMRDGADAGQKSCLVCFQHGKDIQMITAEMVCGPLCGYNLTTLQKWAAWGADRHVHRKTTFVFYGGRIDVNRRETDSSGRAQIAIHHKDRPGWRIVNTAGNDALQQLDSSNTKLFVSYAEEAAKSEFCFSPLGNFNGDTDRYVAALMFGCIPIMLRSTLGGIPMAQPLDEVIDWKSFAVLVDIADLPKLHEILEEYPVERRHAMRRVMHGLWHRFLYTSIYRSYLGETGSNDAFETMMDVLRLRAKINQT